MYIGQEQEDESKFLPDAYNFFSLKLSCFPSLNIIVDLFFSETF